MSLHRCQCIRRTQQTKLALSRKKKVKKVDTKLYKFGKKYCDSQGKGANVSWKLDENIEVGHAHNLSFTCTQRLFGLGDGKNYPRKI